MLFLNEGQTSYWDMALWQEFLKIEPSQPEGPFVATPPSYGSPGEGYVGFDPNMCRFAPTPLRQEPPKEITLGETSGSEEFAHVGLLLGGGSMRFLEHILNDLQITFKRDLKNEVVNASGGHAKILSALIDVICFRKNVSCVFPISSSLLMGLSRHFTF